MAKDLVLSELDQLMKIVSVRLGALEYEIMMLSKKIETIHKKLEEDPLQASKVRMQEYASKGKRSFQSVPYCDPRSDKHLTKIKPES